MSAPKAPDTLNEVLERLLVDRAARDALFAGDRALLGVDAAVWRDLQTIDHEQLRQTAEKLRDQILSRRYRGSGDLTTLFPATIAAWRAAHPEDAELTRLAEDFVASAAYATYREFSFGGAGLCLEEAFFGFACAEELGEPHLREREALAAMVRALAVNTPPAFAVPEAVRRGPRGYWATTTPPGPIALFAAVDGRVIEGEITPFLADLLAAAAPPAEIANRHGVTGDVLDAALGKLRTLGLLA